MRRALFLLLLLSAPAQAALNLTWINPTTNVDGTPIAAGSLVSNRIERGVCGANGTFGSVLQTYQLAPARTSFAVDVAPGCHAFRIYVKNAQGFESSASTVGVITVVAHADKPNPPLSVTAALQATGSPGGSR